MFEQGVRVKVPASTANLGSGFDTVGMAFQLYMTIKMKKAEQTVVRMNGGLPEGIPAGKDNLIVQVAEMVFAQAGLTVPELEIEVESEIPLTRGLGSSASAIVGGMVAANQLAGEPLAIKEIYRMASRLEGHPDNVGASLFGGIVIAAMDGNDVHYVRVEPPKGLKAVVAIPDFKLSTHKARGVLPSSYEREDVVYTLSRAALLSAALATGDTTVLFEAMKDKIHQPYRMKLVPGMEELLNGADKHGALGIALSGAGPTVIALIQGQEESLKQFMLDTFRQNGVFAQVLTLDPDTQGVVVEGIFD